jgi:hypothetical protein
MVRVDKGPWYYKITDNKLQVYSTDFTHDVVMYVTGDFLDNKQREYYAKWLIEGLNKHSGIELPEE